MRGAVHLPGESAYDELVRPWNLAVALHPAAVVRVADAADVAATVRAAAALGRRVAVQCTGHGAAADQRDTILISTADLDECTIHAQERWARVGAGVKWGRVVEQAAPYGLAPLNGSTTDVGVVGYTTGGGCGPIARTYGLASDRVLALEVVTGDGVLRRVTPELEPELFWGLRGAKGVLGVVTAVEFELVELRELYAGALYFDGADTAQVLTAWRTWCARLPEQATTSLALLQLPELPGIPAPIAGRRTVAVRFAWTGDPAEGERLLAPLRAVAEPLIDGVHLMPYTAIDAVHADPVDPMPIVESSALLGELTDDVLEVLLAAAGPDSSSPQLLVELRQLGGALSRPAQHESAFCHRSAPFHVFTAGVPVDPWVEAHGRLLVESLATWTTGARLPNWSPTDDPTTYARCYTPAVLERLRRAVAQYDPQRVIAQSELLG